MELQSVTTERLSLSHFCLVSLVAQTVKCLFTMRETRVQTLVWEDPLEKEMANYSSTLAWKIPWVEEHGRLQSTGSQRVRHDWATSLSVFQPFQDLLRSRMNCPKKNLRDSNHILKVFCKLLNAAFPTSVWFCVAVFYRGVCFMPDEYGLW